MDDDAEVKAFEEQGEQVLEMLKDSEQDLDPKCIPPHRTLRMVQAHLIHGQTRLLRVTKGLADDKEENGNGNGPTREVRIGPLVFKNMKPMDIVRIVAALAIIWLAVERIWAKFDGPPSLLPLTVADAGAEPVEGDDG